MHNLLCDARDAWRSIRATPVVSAIAILSLALGIGANTAIFSLINAMVLRPLPVKDPAGLVAVASADNTWMPNPVAEAIRDQHVFAGTFAWVTKRFNSSRGGPSHFIDGAWASGEFFDVLGVRPALGRMFTRADDAPGGGPSGPVAVISYRLWQEHFGGAADTIGRSLTLERVPFTVIGVMPRHFIGLNTGAPLDVIVPIGAGRLMKGMVPSDAFGEWVMVVGRLSPGHTIEQAAGALRAAQPQIRAATMPPYAHASDREQYLRDPFTARPVTTGLNSLSDSWYGRPLPMLLGIVGLVLTIACGNIANLLLARASRRRREFGIRAALGASRLQLSRRLFVESLLLSLIAAAVGLLCAQWAVGPMVRAFSTPDYAAFFDVSLDWRVLTFAMLAATIAALLAGTAPALGALRTQPMDALADRGRARHRFASAAVVVAQISLSFVLVVGAILLARAFAALVRTDPGFDRDRVLVVKVDVAAVEKTSVTRPATYRAVVEAARGVVDANGAAASKVLPGDMIRLTSLIETQGQQRHTVASRVSTNTVTPGWFQALGIPLKSGRDFDERDGTSAPRTAIVNSAFVGRFFAGRNPLGCTVWENKGALGREPIEIVGIVRDAVYQSIRKPAPATIYFPVAQAGDTHALGTFNLVVRVPTGSPARVANAVAAAVARVNPDLPLTFRTLDEQMSSSVARERLAAVLAAFFGVLALLLAALGLYAITACDVAQRRSEIAIRMALGGSAGSVIRRVLERVAVLTGAGVTIGVALSLVATRIVESLLFGVGRRDVTTLVASAGILLAVGVAAAWVPARRAATTDPVQVLRQA